jgi:hypothetical protein
MKTNFQKLNDIRHSKPLLVMVSRFDAESFPVRVRHLRLTQTGMLKISSEAGNLERGEIPQRQPQGKMNPIDLVSKPVHNARLVSTFL